MPLDINQASLPRKLILAVTIGLLASGRLTPKKAGLYIVCQFVGAIIASAVVFATFGQSMSGRSTFPSDGNVIRALMLETVMTFTLVYVVLVTTTAKNNITDGRFGHRSHARRKCNLRWVCYRSLPKSCTFVWTCLDYG